MLLRCLRRNVQAACHTLFRRLPPSTNSAAYQRLSFNLPWSVAAECIALGGRTVHNTRWEVKAKLVWTLAIAPLT